jgi:uncharacterized protein
MALSASASSSPGPDVWLIDEGTPGHTVQTAGVGKILEEALGARCTWVHCRLRLRGFFRPLARFFANRVSPATASWLIKRLYPELALPAGRPGLVISSCGNSAYLTHLLGRITGAKTIFIGEIAPFPFDWFDLVVAPVDQHIPNTLVAPLMETGQTPQRAEAAARKYWNDRVPAGCWSVLIGGTSRSHPFTETDWGQLAGALNTIARNHGIRWLLTTSRRTGLQAEKLLRDNLEPGVMAEAAWWGTEPKKVVAAYLHAGERVFVTQDSLTMVSEAIAVRGQTVAIQPGEFHFEPDAFNTRYLTRLTADGRLDMRSVDSLADYSPQPAPAEPLSVDQEVFAGELIDWVRANLSPAR